MTYVPIFFGAQVALLFGAGLWRYRNRDKVGTAACLIVAALVGTLLVCW